MPPPAGPQPPTLSVVIPVKDDAQLLDRCLAALAAQTRPADEIVVVDNGSTDITAEVARRWDAICIREDEPGIPAASAAGYDLASGSLIARLDADSEPPSDWVERVVAAFVEDDALDAITGPGDFAAMPRPLRFLADLLYMRAYFAVFGRRAGHPPVFGSNFAMRRKLWADAATRVHRHDPRVHDDLDLSFCVPRDARIRVDPALRVSVSSRPFLDPVAFVRRVRRGTHTLRVNRSRTV